jgi:hypothetical protein
LFPLVFGTCVRARNFEHIFFNAQMMCK